MRSSTQLPTILLICLIVVCAFPSFVFGQSQQTSTLSVIIKDDQGLPTPVRVRLTHSDGRSTPLPPETISIMYGRFDQSERYGYQPDSSFYVNGSFTIDLEPGDYILSLSKGFEFLSQQHEITLEPNRDISVNYQLERWINMPSRGWYSADDHIHIRRSPRENPLILSWISAEDVHVGAILQMGDFWTTYYAQYGWGKQGVYQNKDRLLTSGQEEPRTHEVGHTISLAADDLVRFPDQYYLYDQVFDRVHELGGLTGYAHQGMSFYGYRGMTLDVLSQKIDFLEVLQFCVDGGPLLTDHYYFFLDLGFKMTATAGSDFPWCGLGWFGVGPRWSAQIGNARFYSFVGDEFSFEKWKGSVKAGHTFVTSGPIIDLKINGKIPGDELQISPGEELHITAQAYGHADQIPLQDLEIIAHGEVIKSATHQDQGQSNSQLLIDMKLQAENGLWIAAKCTAGPLQVAHTTPIYITIDGGGFHNSETATENLETCEKYLEEIEEAMSRPPQNPDDNLGRYKEAMSTRISETKDTIGQLKEKLK